MNFWIIFLCLLIGAVIGYEFGKYTVTKRLRSVLNDLGKELRKASDDLRKKKELAETLKKEQKLKEQGADANGQRN